MKKKLPLLFLGVVLLLSFGLKLNHLGHRSFGSIDEGCHALVAKNLLKHPLKPTLIDVPYLFFAETGWSQNHVWLHKPILPLWQIAISYFLFGINTFALRFPSALLSTLAVLLTYLIGKQLLTRRAAGIAASIQAFSWFIMRVTHGYQFSDAIDISLLFYCELGIYGVIRTVKTGQWRFVLLAGCGQGLAFLSKTYPAFIVTGVALAGWLAPYLALARREDCHVRARHIFGILITTLFIAGPWMLYTAVQYPTEFKIEHDYIFKHLTEDVEKWGAPWYKVFLYNIEIYNFFIIPVTVAVCCAVPRLFRQKKIGLCLLYSWGFGVLVPFLIATTKTPSATLIGVPALLLILGDFVARTIERKPDEGLWRRRIRIAWTTLFLILFLSEGVDAWWCTHENRNDKTFAEIAAFAQTHLPKNAVLLTEAQPPEQTSDFTHLRIMFRTDRTAHAYFSEFDWKPASRQIWKHGGIPYLITYRRLNLPLIFNSEADERMIYSIPRPEEPVK